MDPPERAVGVRKQILEHERRLHIAPDRRASSRRNRLPEACNGYASIGPSGRAGGDRFHIPGARTACERFGDIEIVALLPRLEGY